MVTHIEEQVTKAKEKTREIAEIYKGTSPETAARITDILNLVIEFRLGERLQDADRKKKYSELVYEKYDELIEAGFSEGVLNKYIQEMTKIIS